jgi:NAD(P)-dependent dehydrogenase (short-subunit alcohol dehydrogenase family)
MADAGAALAAFCSMDILLSCTGVATIHLISDTKLANWERVQAVNLRMRWLLPQASAPKMIAQNRGMGRRSIQSNIIGSTVILTPMAAMLWGDPMKAKAPADHFGRTTDVADLILCLAASASNRCKRQALVRRIYRAINR